MSRRNGLSLTTISKNSNSKNCGFLRTKTHRKIEITRRGRRPGVLMVNFTNEKESFCEKKAIMLKY
jgi:hypothetical protein